MSKAKALAKSIDSANKPQSCFVFAVVAVTTILVSAMHQEAASSQNPTAATPTQSTPVVPTKPGCAPLKTYDDVCHPQP